MEWTRGRIGEPAKTWLAGLPTSRREADVTLVHGSPRDPVWDYVLDELAVADTFSRTEAPIVLVGHSHVATAAVLSGETIEGGVVPADFSAALGAGRWLLNPGSVGQPRDGDPRAAWLRLDLVSGEARFRRIAYPVARTQAEIRERGLPDSLAERLAHGV